MILVCKRIIVGIDDTVYRALKSKEVDSMSESADRAIEKIQWVDLIRQGLTDVENKVLTVRVEEGI